MNVISRLVFELAYYGLADQNVSYYLTGIPPLISKKKKSFHMSQNKCLHFKFKTIWMPNPGWWWKDQEHYLTCFTFNIFFVFSFQFSIFFFKFLFCFFFFFHPSFSFSFSFSFWHLRFAHFFLFYFFFFLLMVYQPSGVIYYQSYLRKRTIVVQFNPLLVEIRKFGSELNRARLGFELAYDNVEVLYDNHYRLWL